MALAPYPGLRAATSCIAGCGALFTAVMMIYAAQGITLGACLFALWAIAPYAVFIITARVARSRAAVTIALVGCALASAFSAFIYIDAFFVHIHSTNALVFLFIPLYQLVFATVLFAVIYATRRGSAT